MTFLGFPCYFLQVVKLKFFNTSTKCKKIVGVKIQAGLRIQAGSNPVSEHKFLMSIKTWRKVAAVSILKIMHEVLPEYLLLNFIFPMISR